jgi:hypothetical protein
LYRHDAVGQIHIGPLQPKDLTTPQPTGEAHSVQRLKAIALHSREERLRLVNVEHLAVDLLDAWWLDQGCYIVRATESEI